MPRLDSYTSANLKSIIVYILVYMYISLNKTDVTRKWTMK